MAAKKPIDKDGLTRMLLGQGLQPDVVDEIIGAFFATAPFKCHKGHTLQSHPTEGGWCCACDYDIAVMQGRFEDAIGANEEIKLIQKPGHGTCCTCQACGLHHDDCQCFEKEERNAWRDEARKVFYRLDNV